MLKILTMKIHAKVVVALKSIDMINARLNAPQTHECVQDAMFMLVFFFPHSA